MLRNASHSYTVRTTTTIVPEVLYVCTFVRVCCVCASEWWRRITVCRWMSAGWPVHGAVPAVQHYRLQPALQASTLRQFHRPASTQVEYEYSLLLQLYRRSDRFRCRPVHLHHTIIIRIIIIRIVTVSVTESRTRMARPRPRPRRYSINPKVCAMATFPYGGKSCQRARAGTPELWQKRTTSVVTSRQDGNELTLITVFVRIIRTFLDAMSVHLCVIENFRRPRPRPRTWKRVLKDPRGQGHVLEDSITAQNSTSRWDEIPHRTSRTDLWVRANLRIGSTRTLCRLL